MPIFPSKWFLLLRILFIHNIVSQLFTPTFGYNYAGLNYFTIISWPKIFSPGTLEVNNLVAFTKTTLILCLRGIQQFVVIEDQNISDSYEQLDETQW